MDLPLEFRSFIANHNPFSFAEALTWVKLNYIGDMAPALTLHKLLKEAHRQRLIIVLPPQNGHLRYTIRTSNARKKLHKNLPIQTDFTITPPLSTSALAATAATKAKPLEEKS